MFKPIKLIPILLSTLLFLSCSDDDKEVAPPDDELPTEFSELTVEQNKDKLEENGLELVSNIRSLKDAAGVKTTVSFNHFLSSAELPETGRVTSLQPIDLIRTLAAFGEGKASATNVLRSFRSKETEPESGPETAQELFDTNEGVFAYDAALNTWNHTASDDGKIIFRFPSTEEGTTNDAEFVVYGYTSVNVSNAEVDYEGDLPTALKADLTVNGTKQMEYSLTASYKDNGEPTSVETSLTLGSFKFVVKATNNASEASAEYSLANSDKNLISMGVSGNGNFASSNIEQNDEEVGLILENASAYMQIMNIRIAGEADVKTIDDLISGDNVTAEYEAEQFNAHSEFVVFYADSKKKIADVEFYGVTETEEHCYEVDSNGDGISDGQQCEPVEDEYVDIRLVFADDSRNDLETYTDVGFEEIRTELEALSDDLEEDLD